MNQITYSFPESIKNYQNIEETKKQKAILFH